MSTSDPAAGTPAAGPDRPPTVGDVMRPPATTVELRAHLASAAYLMKRRHDSALVVTTDGGTRAPLGLITDSDVTQAVADGLDLEQARVSDLLSGPTVDVAPDIRVVDALRTMLDRRIHHLLVVSDAGLVGIVDMTDLCQALMDVPPPWDTGAPAGRSARPSAPPAVSTA